MVKRVWPRFIITDSGCWLWNGSTNKDGYGHQNLNGRTIDVHKYEYEKKYGAVPKGFELDHKCRVRLCCNPDHMEVVTHVVNMRRGVISRVKENKKWRGD